ncbi:hypothetical protein E2C01_015071 [Portunus trituberculatus]|uniref:Uncharacterized protein n=1 Tax=Portunus trituberculatus TaxID=210409 RepID=A0A5B7DM64_PORTR|nr:hypothetical protein [Portunus trituberculatus]
MKTPAWSVASSESDKPSVIYERHPKTGDTDVTKTWKTQRPLRKPDDDADRVVGKAAAACTMLTPVGAFT